MNNVLLMGGLGSIVLFFLLVVPLCITGDYVPVESMREAIWAFAPGRNWERPAARNHIVVGYSPATAERQSDAGVRGTKARDFYVSTTGSDRTGDGSREHPWSTINHADRMIGPGAIVHVAPGVYAGAVSIKKSGNAAARIVYISEVRWGAKVIVASAADSCFYSTGNYVEIIGFDITESGSGGSCRIGLRVDGGHAAVRSNYVHDLNHHRVISTCVEPGGAGILVTSQPSRGVNHTAVVNANIVDNIGWAAEEARTRDKQHRCVLVHNFYLSMTHLIATNNISLRAEGFGYSMGGHPPAQAVWDQVLVNNISIKDGRGAFYVVNDVPGTTDYAFNNIVDERWSSGVMGFAGSSTVGTAHVSNNLVYMPLGGNAYGMLCPSCVVSNRISGNPGFVSYTGDARGDYHLQSGSPAINRGASLRAPSADFDGTARPQQGAYDIGAYEFALSTVTPQQQHN